jgi:hypothetical protein
VFSLFDRFPLDADSQNKTPATISGRSTELLCLEVEPGAALANEGQAITIGNSVPPRAGVVNGKGECGQGNHGWGAFEVSGFVQEIEQSIDPSKALEAFLGEMPKPRKPH